MAKASIKQTSKAPWFLGDIQPERKQWSFGGTNGTGGNLGTSWLNGVFDLYVKEKYKVGLDELIDNSAVMACVQWVMRAFPEAPCVVAKRKPDRSMGDVVEGHALTELLALPNPHYSGSLMWQATALSLNTDGCAYWLKVRKGGGFGPPAELWWEPNATCRPVPHPQKFISHYEILRDREWQPVPREDVVHFRFGLDPRRPWQGLSPLGAALREVFTDQEAAMYTASILKNMGVVGYLVSPANGDIITDPDALKRELIAKTTGEHRGEPLVSSDPLSLQQLDTDPQKMQLRDIRKIPEERISSLTGVNRMVAGLGPDPTYANYEEAREAAYEDNLIPTHRAIAETLDVQLLPDFEADSKKRGVYFSYAAVRVLQDDLNDLSTRVTTEYEKGVVLLDEARARLGYDPAPTVDAAAPTIDKMQVRLAAQAGIYTVNEARAEFGLPPIEGGDVPLPVMLQGSGMPAEPPDGSEGFSDAPTSDDEDVDAVQEQGGSGNKALELKEFTRAQEAIVRRIEATMGKAIGEGYDSIAAHLER
jgi:HK97 family phage portal protein